MNGAMDQLRAWRRSILRSVGRSDGGGATGPLARTFFSARAKSVVNRDAAAPGFDAAPPAGSGPASACSRTSESKVAARIPQRMAPRMRRACSPAVSSRPKKKTKRSGEASRGLSRTPVPGSLTITPAFSRPMKAMNRPIPTAMPFLMLGLIAASSISRTPIKESARKRIAEMKITPRPICQGVVAPTVRSPAFARAAIQVLAAGSSERTKKKFSPIPGAWAMGSRA